MANSGNRDTQRNAFQLTINNPKDSGFEHNKIKETLITAFPTLRYFCMADEIGEQGTYHTHAYVYFSSRVRFSTVKKHFPTAHIEAAAGTAESNLDYIRKSGKWEDTKKRETSVDGTFEEWGEFPTQKGQDYNMQELYEMVKNGYSNAEILAINNDYILQIDKLDKLRTMLLTEKYKDERRLDLKVVYISGATGTGKTRGILDRHGDSKVYRVTDYDHPFDGYACQSVIAFDEYRSQLRLSDMLNFCDIYPIELPARYANKYACYNTVYIVSNWPLEEQYTETQLKNPTSWQAFLRRIHEVHVYVGKGEVITYLSVDEYMNRGKDGFVKLTDAQQLELPFGDK